MSNLHATAFPIFAKNGETTFNYGGFSKHELATIMIAQGLLSSFPYGSLTKQATENIASHSYEIAAHILKKFE